jgi:fructose-bisphosphate aldolase class II
MPLVTSKKLLEHALANHYAVGAFNANNMEQVQGIIEAAQEERSPVILQVSQGAIRYAGLEFAAGLVKIAASLVDVPVVLHLDHGTDFEQNVLCMRAGFTSLMYDGSKKSFEENVAITKKVVDICHIVGIPVEAELGKVLQSTDGVTAAQIEAAMTQPDEAAKFIELTNADSLATALGSVHAMKIAEAVLDTERVKAIHARIPNTPLVLHGSSGVKEDSIKEVIAYGISKVNVATWLNQGFVEAVRAAVAQMPTETDPRKIVGPGREEVKARVRDKLRVFGCSGVIDSSGGFASGKKSFRSAHIGGTEE